MSTRVWLLGLAVVGPVVAVHAGLLVLGHYLFGSAGGMLVLVPGGLALVAALVYSVGELADSLLRGSSKRFRARLRCLRPRGG